MPFTAEEIADFLTRLAQFTEDALPSYQNCACGAAIRSDRGYLGPDNVRRCINCHNRDVICCEGCSRLSMREGREVYICDNCSDEAVECAACNVTHHHSRMVRMTNRGQHEYYCNEDCRNELWGACSCGHYHRFPFDENRCPDKYPELPTEYRECSLPNRVFSVELETSEIVSCPNGWNVVRDGSVSGMEYLSGPILGMDGVDKIKFGCSKLQDGGVDKACGYHIHINASDLSEDVIQRLVKICVKYENDFFSLVPKNRRENRYCRALNDRFKGNYSIEDIIYPGDTSSQRELDSWRKAIKKEKYYDARYYWLNLHSYYYRGTVEIRSHEGTLDPNEILNWAEFWLKIVEFSRAENSVNLTVDLEFWPFLSMVGIEDKTISFYKEKYEKLNPVKRTKSDIPPAAARRREYVPVPVNPFVTWRPLNIDNGHIDNWVTITGEEDQ